jgi:hypothetical protein
MRAILAALCALACLEPICGGVLPSVPCDNLPQPAIPNSTYDWPHPKVAFRPTELCVNSTCQAAQPPFACAAILDYNRYAACSPQVPCCMPDDTCEATFGGYRCAAPSEAENGEPPCTASSCCKMLTRQTDHIAVTTCNVTNSVIE